MITKNSLIMLTVFGASLAGMAAVAVEDASSIKAVDFVLPSTSPN